MTEQDAVIRGTHNNGHEPTPASVPTLAEMPALTNLTEALPSIIEVRFVEWQSHPLTDDEGQTLKDPETGEDLVYYEPKPRIARISPFVPMRVFNLLIASRDQLANLGSLETAVKAGQDVEQNPDFSPMTEWLREMVLMIWQQSEPQMSRKRFDAGLEFEQVFELFRLFFARLLKRWQEKQAFGAKLRNR